MQPLIIPARVGLGRVLLSTNRAPEALPVMKSAVAMSLDRLGAEHWRTAEAQLVLAECYIARGDAAAAEDPLRKGSTVLSKQRKSHPALAIEAEKVNAALVRTTKPRKAATSGVPWHAMYYQGNYARLQRVKAKWDPRNVFRHALSVRLPGEH